LLQLDNCGETVSKALAEIIYGIRTDQSSLNKSVVAMMLDDNSEERKRQVNLAHVIELCGIKIIEPVKQDLTGKVTFEMTGSPTTHKTKEEFLNAVKDFAVHTKLNADTNYLVTNDTTKMGGKMDKATKLKTKIITYDDFLKLA
jgi:NAD-dependent DNA ligase